MAEFVAWFPGLVPVREQFGFRVREAWVDEANDAFVWSVELDGDEARFTEVEAELQRLPRAGRGVRRPSRGSSPPSSTPSSVRPSDPGPDGFRAGAEPGRLGGGHPSGWVRPGRAQPRAPGRRREGVDLMPTTSTDGPSADVLGAAVDELEALSRFEQDLDRAGEDAVRAADAARALGLVGLALRADLVAADVRRRQGHLAEAGATAQSVLRWATENEAPYVEARAHYVMAAVYQELGDLAQALEHALHSVDLLDDRHPDPGADRPPQAARRLPGPAVRPGRPGPVRRGARAGRAARRRDPPDADPQQQRLHRLAGRAARRRPGGGRADAGPGSSPTTSRSTWRRWTPSAGCCSTSVDPTRPRPRCARAWTPRCSTPPPTATPARTSCSPTPRCSASVVSTRRHGPRLEECIRRCEAHGLTAIRIRARREQAALSAAAGDWQRGLRRTRALRPGRAGPAVRAARRPGPHPAGDVRDHRGPPAEPPLPGAVAARRR